MTRRQKEGSTDIKNGGRERKVFSSKDRLTKKERGRVRYKENKRDGETKRKREKKRDIKNK